MTKNKTNPTQIKNADPKLVAILPEYEFDNFETRYCSKKGGSDALYIRLKRIRPSVTLTIA